MTDSTHPTDGTGALRVILVGRSALDRTLRRDARIELVRARTALDAVGELADPIDADSPLDAVVLVGVGGEPTPAPGGTASGELARFIEALRLIDTGVRVLRIGQDSVGYDGALPESATADDLVALLGKPSAPEPMPEPTPGPEPAPRSEPSPGPSPTRSPRVAVSPEGDADLACALVRGQDLEKLAMERLRARTGIADLRLDPGAGVGVGSSAPVGWNGRSYGTLVTGRVDLPDATLESAASWLSTWLRLAEQHSELSEAAFTDPLTGAWNRRYFDRFLASALETTRARRGNLTLMIFDLDDFKSFNDAAGHVAGDEILCETVRLMRAVVRPEDRVCRIGGDEFAVIFYEPEGPRDPTSHHPEDISMMLGRFQRAIGGRSFPKLGELAPAPLTISGGLATYPWDAHDVAGLVARADELAMESKRTGKNLITVGKHPGTDPA